jgi:hypothetical protein
MTVAVDRDQFDHARVIARAADVLRRNLPLLATLTLLFYGLPKLGSTLLEFGGSHVPVFGPMFSAVQGVYGLVAAVGFVAVQAMVVHVLVEDLGGRPATLAASLRRGLELFVPVLCIVLAYVAATLLGLVLLVVPGLMIATAWLVSIPVAVVERIGVRAALERSASLTRGYRWQVFAFVAIMVLIRIWIGVSFDDSETPFDALPMFETIAAAVQALIRDGLEIIATLAFALVVGSTYCELRRVKEGALPEELAARV